MIHRQKIVLRLSGLTCLHTRIRKTNTESNALAMDNFTPPVCIRTCDYETRISEQHAPALPHEKPALWDQEPILAYFNRAPTTWPISWLNIPPHWSNEGLRDDLVPLVASHRSTFGYQKTVNSYFVTFCHESQQPITHDGGLMFMILSLAAEAKEKGLGLVLVLAGWDALTSNKKSFVELFEHFICDDFNQVKIEMHVYPKDHHHFYAVDPLKVCKIFSDDFPDTYEEAPHREQQFIDFLCICFIRDLTRILQYYPFIENVRFGSLANFCT